MSAYIARGFSTLNITISDRQIDQMERLVVAFETRGTHALALNSQTIAVHPIRFTDSDREALFTLFGTTEHQVVQVIRTIPSINPEFKVASDAFNLFCFWLLHLAHVFISNERVRTNFQVAVAKYLHYRFFTSLISRHFMYGVNEALMVATINELSEKFDILQYKTWRLTIQARCEDLVGPTSIHHKAIVYADDDGASKGGIIYVITDTQTRIRDKIKLIADDYYTLHKSGATGITSKSATMEIEGEKILVQTKSTFDAVTSNMAVEILNVHAFIDMRAVNIIASQFKAINPNMLAGVLRQMSETASIQMRSHDLDRVQTIERQEIYVGMRALTVNIIQASYRYCILLGVGLEDKRALYQRIKNIYSASRIADPNITKVKASVAYFVDEAGRTARDATKSSLRLAILMYIIYRSFRYI